MMNKKGQQLLFGIMIAFLAFISLTILITPMKEFITSTRDIDHLQCDYTNLTTGQQGTCIILDLVLPYFFAFGMGAGLAFLIGKKTIEYTTQ